MALDGENTPARRPSLRTVLFGLVTALAVAIGSTLTAPAAAAIPTVSAMADQETSFDAEMIQYINEARVENGLWPLTEALGLTTLSVWWSDQMRGGATGGELQHYGNAWEDVKNYGASNRLAWGENVGKFTSNATAKQLFDAYMNSPGHRANILSTKYYFIGMGTVSDGSISFNTTEFTDQVDTTTTISVQDVWKTVTPKMVKRNAKIAAQGKAPATKIAATKATAKKFAKKAATKLMKKAVKKAKTHKAVIKAIPPTVKKAIKKAKKSMTMTPKVTKAATKAARKAAKKVAAHAAL